MNYRAWSLAGVKIVPESGVAAMALWYERLVRPDVSCCDGDHAWHR
jgi:hypothetical protein